MDNKISIKLDMPLKDTFAIYKKAVRYIEEIKKEETGNIDRLIHSTNTHTAKYPFDAMFPKMPYRKSAIHHATRIKLSKKRNIKEVDNDYLILIYNSYSWFWKRCNLTEDKMEQIKAFIKDHVYRYELACINGEYYLNIIRKE